MQSQKRQHVGAGVPDREAYDVSQDKAGSHRVVQRLRGYPMNEKKPTYRVEIEYSGTPPNETYGWKIHRNSDVLPILRSQQLFVSRMAGLADANRSRLQLVDTDLQNRKPKEQ